MEVEDWALSISLVLKEAIDSPGKQLFHTLNYYIQTTCSSATADTKMPFVLVFLFNCLKVCC